MVDKKLLKQSAGFTVEDAMELEQHITQINISSEAILNILSKKRNEFVKNKCKPSKEALDLFNVEDKHDNSARLAKKSNKQS